MKRNKILLIIFLSLFLSFNVYACYDCWYYYSPYYYSYYPYSYYYPYYDYYYSPYYYTYSSAPYYSIEYEEYYQYTTPQYTVVQAPPLTVDLKINGSDGPLSVDYNTPLNITWTSNSATYCIASGAWTGNKTTSGSETISNLNIGNYTFTLTCKDNTGRQTSDSVNVTIKAKLPNVITLPAINTL